MDASAATSLATSSAGEEVDTFRGAVSRVAKIAPTPIVAATVQYHAGANGFPVNLMNHVSTYCVVPPNVAIANA
jgi:hypothetical protein